MSSQDSELLEVWKMHNVSKDCLKVARRCIAGVEGTRGAGQPRMLALTGFLDGSFTDVEEYIQRCERNADEHVVLHLWATFEQVLIDRLAEQIDELRPAGGIQNAILVRTRQELSYWKPDILLDLLKNSENRERVGLAKQIKAYRDWVAHRNPAKPPPARVTPEIAFRVLSELLETMNGNQDAF